MLHREEKIIATTRETNRVKPDTILDKKREFLLFVTEKRGRQTIKWMQRKIENENVFH